MKSIYHQPMMDEYSVSGTTYAPEGLIYDNEGVQVPFLS
jgi:P-type Ca2+ transporter type 2A